MTNSILNSLDNLLLRNRSAVSEGDVFSILSHSAFVIRSFEFALVDGAIDCTHTHRADSSFADRLWATEQASLLSDTTSELLLFDIKSSFNFGHHYTSSVFQKRRVAFYICISSADPSFVELIPNYNQSEEDYSTESSESITMGGEANRKVSINNGRRCILPLRSYRLDPTNAPYRMPVQLLPYAIDRVRSCARGEGHYINPWTLVEHPNWHPRTTTSSTHIKPAQHTSHYTAYKAVMDIYRNVNFSSALATMQVDIIGLQPRLADFKLVLLSALSPISPVDHCRKPRQVFVQHKIDSRNRRGEVGLDKVVVMRADSMRSQYWFSSLNRFDFFFIQFTFLEDDGMPPRVSFMFLPERLIPDSFYQSSEQHQSFQRPEFKPYFLAMDEDGIWVTHVQRIVETNPVPQMMCPRPNRYPPNAGKIAADAQDAVAIDCDEQSERPAQLLPDQWSSLDGSLLIRTRQTEFFDNVMWQCAQRKSGLLIVFSNNHPVCDFGFCRYSWTEEECELYLRLGKPPRVSHELHAPVPVVPICYYTQQAETTFEGPSVSSSQFRRLDCCSIPRLILWNLFGPDALENELPVVIPSADVSVTPRQKIVLKSNLQRASDEFAKATPTLSALLHTGLFASEYRPTVGGPEAFGTSAWASLWKLLDDFTLPTTFEHPHGILRQPEVYRTPLRVLHQQLAEEYYHQPAEKRIEDSESKAAKCDK